MDLTNEQWRLVEPLIPEPRWRPGKPGRTGAPWKDMPERYPSYQTCHHRFQENEEFPRSAALASLAHKLDLHLSLDDEESFRALIRCEEMEFLGVPEQRRNDLLRKAREAFEENVRDQRSAAA